MNPPRSIASLFYQLTSIKTPLTHFQYSFKYIETAARDLCLPSAPYRSRLLNHYSNRLHIRNFIEVRSHRWNWVILSHDYLPDVHDTTFTSTDGVILVTLCVGLTRAQDKSWACEFIHSHGHIFI